MKTIGNAPTNPAHVYFTSKGEITETENEANAQFKMNGLTKREQFAMAAMEGLLANSAVTFPFGYPELVNSIAVDAVSHADALIAALNREVTNGKV
jgi:hypothetical protein